MRRRPLRKERRKAEHAGRPLRPAVRDEFRSSHHTHAQAQGSPVLNGCVRAVAAPGGIPGGSLRRDVPGRGFDKTRKRHHRSAHGRERQRFNGKPPEPEGLRQAGRMAHPPSERVLSLRLPRRHMGQGNARRHPWRKPSSRCIWPGCRQDA